MTDEAEKRRERVVNSLQQIYAVVIALAITQSIQNLLGDPANKSVGVFTEVLTGLPAFVAFSFTVVPFWHGMNRHLDRCYIEKKGSITQRALLFDFGAFFVEGALLFAAAWSLTSGLNTFLWLGLLLSVDMLWGALSHVIHFSGTLSHVRKWAAVNIIAIAVALLIVAFHPLPYKSWFLMSVAVARTIADYRFCRAFYFPAPQGV